MPVALDPINSLIPSSAQVDQVVGFSGRVVVLDEIPVPLGLGISFSGPASSVVVAWNGTEVQVTRGALYLLRGFAQVAMDFPFAIKFPIAGTYTVSFSPSYIDDSGADVVDQHVPFSVVVNQPVTPASQPQPKVAKAALPVSWPILAVGIGGAVVVAGVAIYLWKRKKKTYTYRSAPAPAAEVSPAPTVTAY